MGQRRLKLSCGSRLTLFAVAKVINETTAKQTVNRSEEKI
jgi:hypothetical protein